MVKAEVEIEGTSYSVVIRKNEERNFDTSSDYEDTQHPLGLPKVILFIQLLNNSGPYYFDTIRNWDKEKNKLLEAYGYSLSDNLKGKFEFTYKEGKPFLRVLDPSIKRIVQQENLRAKPVVVEEVIDSSNGDDDTPFKSNGVSHRIGIVFNWNQELYPGFSIDAVAGEVNDEHIAFI